MIVNPYYSVLEILNWIYFYLTKNMKIDETTEEIDNVYNPISVPNLNTTVYDVPNNILVYYLPKTVNHPKILAK